MGSGHARHVNRHISSIEGLDHNSLGLFFHIDIDCPNPKHTHMREVPYPLSIASCL